VINPKWKTISNGRQPLPINGNLIYTLVCVPKTRTQISKGKS
jgi:hypothetical protein